MPTIIPDEMKSLGERITQAKPGEVIIVKPPEMMIPLVEAINLGIYALTELIDQEKLRGSEVENLVNYKLAIKRLQKFKAQDIALRKFLDV